jgi:hypothetical protein
MMHQGNLWSLCLDNIKKQTFNPQKNPTLFFWSIDIGVKRPSFLARLISSFPRAQLKISYPDD